MLSDITKLDAAEMTDPDHYRTPKIRKESFFDVWRKGRALALFLPVAFILLGCYKQSPDASTGADFILDLTTRLAPACRQ